MKNGGTKMSDKENQGSQETSISEFIGSVNEVAITAMEMSRKIVESSEVRMEFLKAIRTEDIQKFKFLKSWLEMTLEVANISKVLSIISNMTEEGMSLREEITTWAEEKGMGDDTKISFGMPLYFGEE